MRASVPDYRGVFPAARRRRFRYSGIISAKAKANLRKVNGLLSACTTTLRMLTHSIILQTYVLGWRV